MQTDWSVDFFLTPGSSAADRGHAGRGQMSEAKTEAEAKILASRQVTLASRT